MLACCTAACLDGAVQALPSVKLAAGDTSVGGMRATAGTTTH